MRPRDNFRRAAVGITATIFPLVISGLAAADQPLTGANLNTPESPASSIVGAGTQGVTQPGSPAALGAALLNGFDINGNLKTGVGAEANPFAWTGTWIKPADYQHDPVKRFFGRLNFSAATAKGASNADNSAQVGVGLRGVIFDWSDPAMDGDVNHPDQAPDSVSGCTYEGQVEAARSLGEFDPGKLPPGDATVKLLEQQATQKCLKEASARLWNRSSWNFGVANSWASTNGAVHNLTQQTYQLNSTFAWGFDNLGPAVDSSTWKNLSGLSGFLERNAQLIVGAQYSHHQLVPNPAKSGTFYVQDAEQLGSQLRWHFVDTKDTASEEDQDFSFRNTLGSLEVVYTFASPEGMSHSNDLTIIAGLELKLGDATYLDFGSGVERKQMTGKNAGFALTQFKYALDNASSLWSN